ncbi:MAG: AAA family ATPase, partial [Thiotrichaceae bacterium]
MIIRSLTAENFRKYKRLEIDNVPEKGLITISGENESGKTSIADALSFALFGRTFLTVEQNASKLIAWGEKNASVILNFINKGEAYQLTRIVNAEGTVDAQLFSEKNAELIADTPEETEAALQEIMGYGYETFSDSYYLVQRELSTPHPNSDSIKDMVGISTYSRISNEMHRANDIDDDQLAQLRPQYEKAYKDLQDMGIDDSWLPELVDTRDSVETDQDYKQQLVAQLRNSADTYTGDRKQFIAGQRKHRTFGVFSDLLLAALAVALGLWALIKFLPNVAQPLLMPQTVDKFTVFSSWTELWMPLLAAVLAISFLLSMVMTWRTEDRILSPLKHKSQLYSEALDESYQHAKTDLSDSLSPRSLDLITQASGGILPLVNTDHAELAKVHTLKDQIAEYYTDGLEAEKTVEVLRFHIKEQQRHNETNLAVLGNEIDTEMERTAIAAEFRQKLAEYDTDIRHHTRNIKVQNMAIDLLRNSAKEFTDAFNNSITKASANILPFFTNNHYSNVKIDDDLNVAVFSKEKNDFMDFDEISSGTQRQIMLALRIAMSEELAKTNDIDKQFIILDEPFA